MIPLCTRLSCLDIGPIVHAIKSVARGECPDVESAAESAIELMSVALLAQEPVERILSGKLMQTEALALLADEPCPPTERGGQCSR